MTIAPTMTRQEKKAARLRDWADRLNADAERKEAPRQENTRKRQIEAQSARCEARDLRAAAAACTALAKAWDRDECPADLQAVTKAAIVSATYRHRCCAGGMMMPTDEWTHHDPISRAIRELADAYGVEAQGASAADIQLAAEEARAVTAGIPGFFPTPIELAREMVEYAAIEWGMTVLEPSAGKGDIVQAMHEAGALVDAVEINPVLCRILRKRRDRLGEDTPETALVVHECDFLTGFEAPEVGYHAIVMNPPFEKAQDAAHVMRAHQMLTDSGVLVALVSPGLFFRQTRAETQFREWFETNNGERIRDIPSGTFPSTGAAAVLIRVPAN